MPRVTYNISPEQKERVKELRAMFPSGLMTLSDVARAYGHENNHRFAVAFTSTLTPHYDAMCSKRKKWRIEDIAAREYSL